jgi:hypothetical protein
LSQAQDAVAIGNSAGASSQGAYAVAIGTQAGETNQASSSIILNASGSTLNSANSGFFVKPIRSGTNSSGQNNLFFNPTTSEIQYSPSTVGITSVGPISLTSTSTGAYVDLVSNTLVLTPADATNPGIVSTETQTFAGEKTFQNIKISSSQIGLGSGAGYVYQGLNTVAIGSNAGWQLQKAHSIGIGTEAAFSENGDSSIAIGYRAGFRLQYSNAIAIGTRSGNEDQLGNAIAIGTGAGFYTQRYNAIAIGKGAGYNFQQDNSVAIGNEAGKTFQGSSAVAIGLNTGKTSQGQYAVAIGTQAGETNQATSSIILNASGSTLNSANSGFFVNPIRSGTNSSGQNNLFFNPTTSEIQYSPSTVGITSVGPISLTSTSTGAYVDLVSNTLVLTAADATNPGIVSTSTQTFAGAKTFNSDLTVNGIRFGRGAGDIGTNTAIGFEADVANSNLENATAIGAGAIAANSHSIQLGNYDVTNVKTYGTITAGGVTYPNTAGTNGYVLSTDGNSTASWVDLSSMYARASDLSNYATTQDLSSYATTASLSSYALTTDLSNYATTTALNILSNDVSTNYATKAYVDSRPPPYSALAPNINEMITAAGFNTSSDKRLKTNITPLSGSLDAVLKLLPLSYEKKTSLASNVYSIKENGFLAQDLQKIFPSLVTVGKDKDKLLSVNYISLIPILTKAIQEQQVQIEEKAKVTDELKKQLDRQQKEIDELRELIKGIKK